MVAATRRVRLTYPTFLVSEARHLTVRDNEGDPPQEEPSNFRGVPFAKLLRYYLWLGTLGFGGPIAAVGYMQRDLVEKRGWLSREEFLNGVALGQTMPGPLAAQVSMWVGYLRGGSLGALAVAIPFILPSFILVVGIGYLYHRYQGLAIVASLFYGIAPAVMAIIAIASVRLARLTNKRDTRLWVISATVLVVTAITASEIALLFIGAGLAMMLWEAPPKWAAWRGGAPARAYARRVPPCSASRRRSAWVG